MWTSDQSLCFRSLCAQRSCGLNPRALEMFLSTPRGRIRAPCKQNMQTLTPNLALRRTEQFPLPISHGRPRQHSDRLLCSWLATTQATLAEVVLFIPQVTTSSRSMRPSPPLKGSVALLLSGCGRLRFCPKQPCSQLPRGAISPGDAHEGSELRARSRVEAKPRPPLACGARAHQGRLAARSCHARALATAWNPSSTFMLQNSLSALKK